jgi:cytochrome c biogenesis protein CcmG/thiol:disulfide interchange protein DsbE
MTLNECYDEAQLKSYLDDALPASEREEADAHLAACADCRVKLGDLRALAVEVSATFEAHIDVPDGRIALARLHVAQRANGTAARVRAGNSIVDEVPVLPVKAEATISRMPVPRGRMRFALAGMGVALAIVMALGLTVLFAPGTPGMVGVPGGGEQFLPAGKVRHMVFTKVYASQAKNEPPQSAEQNHEEFWIVSGKSHPLMRSYVSVPITAWTWIDEDYLYEYEPAQGKYVTQQPYDPTILTHILPDPDVISRTLHQSPDAQVSDEILDGRPVTKIVITSNTPANLTQLPGGGSTYTADRITSWIDKQTYQLLQFEGVITTTGGLKDGFVEKQLLKITVNELVNRSELPDDYFTFKLPPGAVLGEQPAATVGELAPELTAQDIRTNQPVVLTTLRGKPMVLVLWATWCGPCLDTLATLNELHNEVGNDISFAAVSLGPPDTNDGVLSFVQSHRYDWRFLNALNSSVLHPYYTTSVPITYFIDKEGIVRFIQTGGADAETLRKGLDSIR